jgi:RNA polymerase sigma-70 factor (ECF subfamily)
LVAVPSIGRADQAPARSAPEAEAARDLYERYARQIYTYCLHQLRNKEEAEDATQSTFLNAFRGLQRGVDPEFESAWLYKIAQNVCLTRQRSSSRRRKVESPGDLDSMQDFVPAHEVDSDELIRLPEALEEMPEQQRRALLLREWQGLSYREIADELGLSQAAVETLLFRARRTLAAGLTEEQKPTSVAKRVRAGDVGSMAAVVKSLALTAGSKVAATVATVVATSVVAATPSARHVVEHAVIPSYPSAAPVAHVVQKHASASPKKHSVAVPHHTAGPRVLTSAHVVAARAGVAHVHRTLRRSALVTHRAAPALVVARQVAHVTAPAVAPPVPSSAEQQPAVAAAGPPDTETPPPAAATPDPAPPAQQQPAPAAPSPSASAPGQAKKTAPSTQPDQTADRRNDNGNGKGKKHGNDADRTPQGITTEAPAAAPAPVEPVASTPTAPTVVPPVTTPDPQPVAASDPVAPATTPSDDVGHGRGHDQGDRGNGKKK